MVSDLSAETQAMFDVLLRERLLPYITQHLPTIEDALWTVSSMGTTTNNSDEKVLANKQLIFSSEEPAINRYATGGSFLPHTDNFALTLNVLLSDTFTGGGTLFWDEDGDDNQISKPGKEGENAAVCVLPGVGVGVLFNGSITHAGREVTSGLRHLLVGSFSIQKSSSSSSNTGSTPKSQ